MDALKSSRFIAGNGTPESAWKAAPQLERAPCHPLNWWMPLGTRLVVLAPHPDDEILACGALLQQHAQRGGECLVVAATDGEASHPPTQHRSAAQLATTRQAETLRGLSWLGLTDDNVVRLGLPDGQLAHRTDDLCRALQRLLRPTDLVITTYRLDGHPDHEACAGSVAQVCTQVNCRLAQAPVWLWHWAAPDESTIPWNRLHGFQIPHATQTLKLQALAEHRSQLDGAAHDGTRILGEAIVQRAQRPIEYFFL
ncbi:MAG: PIG-L family deacetylase [Ferruginibacter sp.]|nr:PIG-L family deacetylase [Rhodoferax sp.]